MRTERTLSSARRDVARGCTSWSTRRAFAWAAAAFVLGSVPVGRLVTRALTGQPLSRLGDGKPGSANVARSLGWGPGAAVFALDAGKAFVPAAAARLSGAGDTATAAAGIGAMLGHIMVVRGRGVASGIGAGLAVDPAAMAVASVPMVAGSLARRHAEAVAVSGLMLPPISVLIHRGRPRRAVTLAAIVAIILATRLRGTGPILPPSRAALRSRLWCDSEA